MQHETCDGEAYWSNRPYLWSITEILFVMLEIVTFQRNSKDLHTLKLYMIKQINNFIWNGNMFSWRYILLSIDTVKSKKYVALKWENVHFIWKHIMSRYFQLLCFRCKKLFRRNICIKAFLECGAYQYKGREGSRILSKSK